MNSPFLNFGSVRLINLDYARAVYEEVLGDEDCYRKAKIREGSIVIDVGGFCGEFGIWCALEKRCNVFIYEPSEHHLIARFNAILNGCPVYVFHAAIGNSIGLRRFKYKPEAATSSQLSDDAEGVSVECFTLKHEIAKAKELFGDLPVCVKLDCEGAEREIFDDESWLDGVYSVLLEFHYKDGERYREILRRHGFTLDTTDPNPEAWRAVIYAERNL